MGDPINNLPAMEIDELTIFDAMGDAVSLLDESNEDYAPTQWPPSPVGNIAGLPPFAPPWPLVYFNTPQEHFQHFLSRLPPSDSVELHNIVSVLVMQACGMGQLQANICTNFEMANRMGRLENELREAKICLQNIKMRDSNAKDNIHENNVDSPTAGTGRSLKAQLGKRTRDDGDGSSHYCELAGHSDARKLDKGRPQLEAMIAFGKEKTETTLPVLNKAKAWASRYLHPVMCCLQNHFGSDKDRFLETYPNYNLTDFPSTCCCGGAGSVCAPKKKK